MEYENIKCNLCGNDDYTVIYPAIKSATEVPIESRYSAAKGVPCADQVVRCKHCSLVYINPRPRSDTIIDAVSAGEDEVYVSQPKGRMVTFEKGLELLHKYAKPGKLLDVGCAAGFFVNVAKKAGWDARGVEPNTWLCEFGNKTYGLSNLPMTLDKAKFAPNTFDVVTLWDVFEHMPDPRSQLKIVNKVMKPDGILIVSYPEWGSIQRKASGRKWWFLLSHHLFYFDKKTISRMLREEGFSVLKTKMHWQQLQLGYMMTMFHKLNEKSIAGKIAGVCEKVLKLTRTYNLKIWYYAAQTDLVARKVA